MKKRHNSLKTVTAVILALVVSLTGCVNRSDAYSDKEIEKEKIYFMLKVNFGFTFF